MIHYLKGTLFFLMLGSSFGMNKGFFYSKEGNEFQNQYIWEKYERKVSHLEWSL